MKMKKISDRIYLLIVYVKFWSLILVNDEGSVSFLLFYALFVFHGFAWKKYISWKLCQVDDDTSAFLREKESTRKQKNDGSSLQSING